MSVIILTTGVPGCGKSYVRCARFLVDDFLVNTNGVHISNFPVNVDEVSAAVFKKISKSRGIFGIFRKKVTQEDIKKRIIIIPDDELQRWRSGVSGPWDYFQGVNLKYAHIAIDEIHNFLNSRCSDDVLKKWDDFLGEVRHRGCTFEGLTQDIDQVEKVLTGRAAIRLELLPGEDLRDPYFKIKMADWYELKAAFLGSYHKTVFMFEKRKSGSGRWVTNHVSRFLITPEYFKYYNSFNASLQEKEKGTSDEGRAVEYEYQRRTKLSLLVWFIRRNLFSLFSRFLIAGLLLWLCFFGGINFLLDSWFSATTSMAKSNQSPEQVQDSSKKDDPAAIKADDPAAIKKDDSDSFGGPLSEAERKELRQEKKDHENGFKPGMFFDGFCWLRNGIRIYVGFKFNNEKKHGDFYGKTVEKIDSVERFYILDDGLIIDMF